MDKKNWINTVDGQFDDGRVLSDVVLELESVRSVIKPVAVSDRQRSVPIANFDLVLVPALHLVVISEPHGLWLRISGERDLYDDVLALFEDGRVLEAWRQVDFRGTWNTDIVSSEKRRFKWNWIHETINKSQNYKNVFSLLMTRSAREDLEPAFVEALMQYSSASSPYTELMTRT